MDLFGLIMQYLNDYVFNPIKDAMDNYFFGNNPMAGSLVLDKGSFYFIPSTGHMNAYEEDIFSIPITNDNGDILYYANGVSIYDLLLLLTTLVIFILLFIFAVKFIVWLFKQISFITRF